MTTDRHVEVLRRILRIHSESMLKEEGDAIEASIAALRAVSDDDIALRAVSGSVGGEAVESWLVRCRRTGRVIWSDPSRSTAEGYARHIAHRMPDNTLDTEVIPLCTRSAASVESLSIPAGLHPSSANLVERFATALAEKLYAAEQKYGYSDGWASPDWMDECRANLLEHVAKGDPRDVAAYCAFLWHHGASTAPAQSEPPAEGGAINSAEVERVLDEVLSEHDERLSVGAFDRESPVRRLAVSGRIENEN